MKKSTNRRTKRTRFCLLLVPVVMCLVITVIATFTFLATVLSPGTADMMEAQSQTLIFSLLGTAITVWVSLNIYNVLSKEDLNGLLEEAARASELTQDVYTQVLASKLRLMPADRIENYLASALLEMERLPEELLHKMITLEDQFNYAYCLYKENAASPSAEQGLKLTEELRKDMTVWERDLSRRQMDYLRGYLAMRKADLLFFLAQTDAKKRGEIMCDDGKELLKQYYTALYCFFGLKDFSCCGAVENYSAEECEGLALIANDICAVYVVLIGRANCPQKREKDMSRAIQAGKAAVRFGKGVAPHTRAVFQRNLGVAYEWAEGAKETAFAYYYEAYQHDPSNPKTLHCIASWYRKWLCEKYPLLDQEKGEEGIRLSAKENKDAKELLETAAYWFWLELSCSGGTLCSWPVDLCRYAQRLMRYGDTVTVNCDLIRTIAMGHACFENLKWTGREYKAWSDGKKGEAKVGRIPCLAGLFRSKS